MFFLTNQALTDDDPIGGGNLYMYDATKPASDPHNLTLVSSGAGGIINASEDGRYVYFISGAGRSPCGMTAQSSAIGSIFDVDPNCDSGTLERTTCGT